MYERLKEGEDFYYDDTGLMVFTGSYLLKRGFCCKSGCTHCPYGFVRDSENRNKQSKMEKK